MADANFSAATLPAHPTSSHPMATPGYGKRSAPGQLRRTHHDFAHLPPREGAIAGYIDRLPDGADISVKTLAKELPYGQCALRTALNRLQEAGHLRRGREHARGSDSVRWITRTWWTRTARDDDWWTAFTRGDVPEERPGAPEPTTPEAAATAPEPAEPARRGPTLRRAYVLLAALGRTAPALSLSHADCLRLAPHAAEWFTRGATEADLQHALTAGLPSPVHSPAGLVHNRLTTKLPPEPVPRPALRVLECATCGSPGRAESLPGGTCARCRGDVPAGSGRPDPLSPAVVRSHAAKIRAATARTPARSHA
ncbi:hypothetical protein [Streptomyces sp. N35]|uniref:hypothetical protein n=1 Tax=Streptomyces sp. N35 TaxID=2795730 RepID=UPI001F437BCB|nr:hypothetical protein [Streptomyces sp. N35]